MKAIRVISHKPLLGLLAQGLTFVATLIPIAAGLHSELVTFVVISGIATILVHPATLGVHSTFASIRSPHIAAITIAASTLVLLAAVFSILIVSLVSLVQERPDFASASAATACLLAGQGMYYFVLAYSTRIGSHGLIAGVRIAYSVMIVILTLMASTVARSSYSLPVAAAVSFGLSAIGAMVVLRGVIPWRALADVRFKSILSRAWEMRSTTIIFALSGMSGQVTSLALPFLGQFAVPFAVIARVATGFQTVGAQVIAPRFDVEYARAVRTRNTSMTHATYTRATKWGIALAIIGVTISLIVLTATESRPLSSEHFVQLLAATILFWGAQICASTVGKFLTFSGFTRARLIYEFSRALPLTLAVVFLRDEVLLWGLSAVMCVSMISFMWLGHERSKWLPAREHLHSSNST